MNDSLVEVIDHSSCNLVEVIDHSPCSVENGMNGMEGMTRSIEQMRLSSPSSNGSADGSRRPSKPVFLGDDDDHSSRALNRDAISPSPRQDERRRAEQKAEALADLTECYKGILTGVGEDINRQGLRKTPERAAKAMLYFTKGYDEKIEGELQMVVPYTICRICILYQKRTVLFYMSLSVSVCLCLSLCPSSSSSSSSV